jgi:hypothetical protein
MNNSRFTYRLKTLLIIILFTSISLVVFAQWYPAGTLALPRHSYTFLKTTSSGDLLAVTFNDSVVSQQTAEMPTLLIKNPLSGNPEIRILCQVAFKPDHGYSGVTCDASGNIYVSADTGEATTSFIRKFNQDGSPDPSFGTQGEIRPGKRCLGIDVAGNHILCAVDWGEIYFYDTSTGSLLGKTPKASEGFEYVRDIAIDPSTGHIFGVVEGSTVLWEGGSPANPAGYRFRTLTPKVGTRIACEGIAFDPFSQSALTIPVPRNTFLKVDARGKDEKTLISDALQATHIVDLAVSPEGIILFMSALETRSVYVFQRTVPEKKSQPATSPASAPIPSAVPSKKSVQIGPVTWYISHPDIMVEAQSTQKPLLLYFRKENDLKCLELETTILTGEAFIQKATDFFCVFEDINSNPALSPRFAIDMVPEIVLLDSTGTHVGSAKINISSDLLSTLMDLALKK